VIMLKDRLPRLVRTFLASAACAAGSLMAADAARAGSIGSVFYIEMENHNFTQPSGDTSAPQQILNNPAAPFQNSLLNGTNPIDSQVSSAGNYYNVLATAQGATGANSIHPSEPNYLWQEAGRNFGVYNDNDPYSTSGPTVQDAPTLSGLLQRNGISWKSYQEDTQLATNGQGQVTSTVLPQNQWTVPTTSLSGTSTAYTNPYNGSSQYNFAVKHDGSLFFTETNGGTLSAPNNTPSNPEASHYAPMQQLATDLANNTVGRYNVITPNQYNDSHSSVNTNFTYNGVTYTHNTDAQAIALGDNFLSIIVPQIMASQAYKNNGAIVIWWDETEGTNANDLSHTLEEIVISPLAKGNDFVSSVPYTHSSDLKSMQELFGVSAPGGGFLGDANTPGTNDLSDLFVAGALGPAAVPEPTSIVLMGLGIGGVAVLRRFVRVAAPEIEGR
jgi:hypothetical protein